MSARGWSPSDVKGRRALRRALDRAFDARTSSDYMRFIEVKGRAQTGDIVLTAPEVDKLRQLGERAFLYVATFCKSIRRACGSSKIHPATGSRELIPPSILGG
jgi:hypothetical protein